MSGVSSGSAIGSLADMCRRMRAVLPLGWFAVPDNVAGSITPILDGLLSGIGFAWQWCYALVSFVQNQTRIATATGSFLDFVCADFFGSTVARYPSEIDDSFRMRIGSLLFAEVGTRRALLQVVQRATGVEPVIREGQQGAGLAGYGLGGYGVSGLSFGSAGIPYASLITCVPGGSYSTRQSTATYVDTNGQVHVVSSNVPRLLTQENGTQSVLAEGRAFNLVKDSVNWSGFRLSAICTLSTPTSSALGGVFWAASVITMDVVAGGQVLGPAITVAVADQDITASLWIQVFADGGLTALQVVLTDEVGQATTMQIGMTPGWQRVQATHSRTGTGAGSITMVLDGVAIAGGSILQTQCWQIEAGLTATSYIPSDGSVSFRDADKIVACATAPFFVLDPGTRDEMVRLALPAGARTWIRDLR